MGFSRQKYWIGLSLPTARDLPDPGMEPPSLVFPAMAGGFFTTSTTWETQREKLEGGINKSLELTDTHHCI